METFRSKIILSRLLFATSLLIAGGNVGAADHVASLIDSPCFLRMNGGYLLHSTLPDGTLRLTAEATSKASGLRWGLELLVKPEELRSIWAEAIRDMLTESEIAAAEVHCRAGDSALKEAQRKLSINSTIASRPEMERQIRNSIPNFPNFPNFPINQMKEVLTLEEGAALEALKGDPIASVAYSRLRGLAMNQRILHGFQAVANQRVRHIPWIEDDHRDEFTRNFFKRSLPRKP